MSAAISNLRQKSSPKCHFGDNIKINFSDNIFVNNRKFTKSKHLHFLTVGSRNFIFEWLNSNIVRFNK